MEKRSAAVYASAADVLLSRSCILNGQLEDRRWRIIKGPGYRPAASGARATMARDPLFVWCGPGTKPGKRFRFRNWTRDNLAGIIEPIPCVEYRSRPFVFRSL